MGVGTDDGNNACSESTFSSSFGMTLCLEKLQKLAVNGDLSSSETGDGKPIGRIIGSSVVIYDERNSELLVRKLDAGNIGNRSDMGEEPEWFDYWI